MAIAGRHFWTLKNLAAKWSRGEGGQALNGQMPLKNSKIECRWPLIERRLVIKLIETNQK